MFSVKPQPQQFQVVRVSQVRYRRMLAYPPYTSKGYIPPSRKGKKQTVFRKLMNEFLGEKNYKGQYFDNRLAYLKQNNSTNYLDGPASRSGVKLSEGPQAHRVSKDPKAVLRPFSLNRFTVTNTLVSKDMKQEIVADVESGKSLLAVAVKYKMKIPRVEAILKLNEIEKQFEASGKKTPDLATFASVMNKAFPLYDPQEHGENLTEIPIPSETLHSRFVTIAESEPFGPVDAAKEFGLEPAAETLRKVTEEGEDALNKRRQTRIQKTFVAPMHQGDTTAFKFTDVKVGQVGFRYGKPYRDNRKDRKYAFDNAGNMYAVLE